VYIGALSLLAAQLPLSSSSRHAQLFALSPAGGRPVLPSALSTKRKSILCCYRPPPWIFSDGLWWADPTRFPYSAVVFAPRAGLAFFRHVFPLSCRRSFFFFLLFSAADVCDFLEPSVGALPFFRFFLVISAVDQIRSDALRPSFTLVAFATVDSTSLGVLSESKPYFSRLPCRTSKSIDHSGFCIAQAFSPLWLLFIEPFVRRGPRLLLHRHGLSLATESVFVLAPGGRCLSKFRCLRRS